MFITNKIIPQIIQKIKGGDLHLRFPLKLQNKQLKNRRTSAFTSGSITIEASFVVPIFFFAAICLLYLFEIMAIQTAVRSGMSYAGKKQAEEMYGGLIASPGSLEEDIARAIGEDRLERSIIVGGSQGITCNQSYISQTTKVLTLEVEYKVKIPFPLFSLSEIPYREVMQIKGWTGYVPTGFAGEREKVVYITETGVVYHENYKCTHLDLSIQLVAKEGIEELRNQYQGRYTPCNRCGNGAGGDGVYITDTGNHYHNQIACSGLKRTIFAIPISEAIERGACSRCA